MEHQEGVWATGKRFVFNGRHRKGSQHLSNIVQKFGPKGIRVIFSVLFSHSLNWSFWPQIFLPLTKLFFVCLLGSFFFFFLGN